MSSSKIVKKSEQPPSVAKLLLVAALSFYFLHELTLIDNTPPKITPQMVKTMTQLQLFQPVIECWMKTMIITFGLIMQFLIPGICLAAAFWQIKRKL